MPDQTEILFADRPRISGISILHGDCLALLADLEADSIDAVITDPPYNLGFMGRAWDRSGIAFQPDTWAAIARVMKPGAHLVACGGTRTAHRMQCAIEDGGFEYRDTIAWLYGSGFPKSRNALKPAFEPITLARKPFQGSVAGNVLAHGTGGINIGTCRVEAPDGVPVFEKRNEASAGILGDGLNGSNRTGATDITTGRWPANVVHDGSADVMAAFARFGDRQSGGATAARFFASCPYNDDDQRFHYSAKARPADRAGSRHPTVKPVSLLRWLCRLITPPGGVILDPFAGSGTTGAAARAEGFRAVLMEREAEYFADMERRFCGG